MRHAFPSFAALAVAAALLSACGGGGGTAAAPPTSASSATPAPAASIAPASLSTAQLNGAPGFVNSSGMTTYTFDADTTANVSACSGSCSSVWPALKATAGVTYASPFATFVRADGTTQLSYNGHPLYTYVGDSAPGSVAGDGLVEFGATWHIARPLSASPAPTASAAASPAASSGPY